MNKQKLDQILKAHADCREKLGDMLESIDGMHGTRTANGVYVAVEFFSISTHIITILRQIDCPDDIVNDIITMLMDMHRGIVEMALQSGTEQYASDPENRKRVQRELSTFHKQMGMEILNRSLKIL